MSRELSRSPSNSGSAVKAAARLAMKPVGMLRSAACSCRSASASRAFALKAGEVISMLLLRLADRGAVGHAGQHLGDVAGGDGPALAGELARHIEQAAEIAGEQRAGATVA